MIYNKNIICTFKNVNFRLAWRFMLRIPVIWEAKIGKIMVSDQSGLKIHETTFQLNGWMQ
jgi:hypothetical protein